MTTRKHNITTLAIVFTLAFFVLGSGIGQQADAATVFNYVGLGVVNTPDVDPGVSSTDLLNGLPGVVTGQPAHGASAPIGVVTNGLYGWNLATEKFLPADTTAGSGAVSTWTYTLGAASNIGEVRVYSADNSAGNIGPRNAYDYDLKFFDAGDVQIGSTIDVLSGFGGTLDAAGSGTAHVRGNTYDNPPNPGLPDFNQTHYTQVADDAGFLATGVSKVSFTFRPVRVDDTGVALLASAIGYTWVSEIDVFAEAVDFPSAPTVPEPSTFALAALGLLSLGLAGWRPRKTRG